MLQKLSIKNYAIIDELEIDFSGRLNVITGETGAGKSIIAGALGLILGERADNTALVNKEKKCTVEGLFAVAGKKKIKDFLEKNDLDYSDELLIRREIGTNGKSRAFINDTPVILSELNELSSLLVDLHQQFDSQELGKTDFQREVLDALAGHSQLVEEFSNRFREWQQSLRQCEELKQQKLQFDREADYNRFQYNELAEAGFRENELEEIEAELKILSHAEGIRSALSKVYYELKESETPVVQQLKTLVNQLQAFATYHPDLPALSERMQSAQIELQDIAEETNNISNHVNYSPEKIEQFNERLSQGYRLLKKHGLKTTNELLQVQNILKEKLEAVLNIEEIIRNNENEASVLFNDAVKLAEKISEGRIRQAKPLEEKVNKLLTQVGMPNARLKVEVEVKGKEEMDKNGCDKIEFLFDANLPASQAGKKGQFLPVRKVASGGELSRLMLCIKSLVAQSIDLGVLIFDEIDSGISGEAARQVGIIMKDLAAKRQVISITHQPQIAGRADAHFLVYKEIVKDAVKTNIRLLNSEERITTIARMLGGEKPTAAALENAREMVSDYPK